MGDSTVADEILSRLDALQAEIGSRFDRLEGKVDRLEGNVDRLEGNVDRLEGTVDRLEGTVDRLEGTVDRLEGKVDELHKDFHSHQKMTSDNFDTVIDTLQAMRHAGGGPTRVAR
jgi:predicted nuclease with TOPRIM domain